MENVNALEVKGRLTGLGADLCGIADPGLFTGAPKGYHPRDTLPDCRAVIVFAKRFLGGTLRAARPVPYTIVRNHLSAELDRVAVSLCYELEERTGCVALPTGTIGPSDFDEGTGRSRNIVSAKHSAQLAGLGSIGRNTLVITPEYGNMVWLSVILTDLPLEPDPPAPADFPCPPGCRLCVEACPVHAVGEPEMEQRACWNHAFRSDGKNDFRIRCNRCRTVCPHCFGHKNRPQRDSERER